MKEENTLKKANMGNDLKMIGEYTSGIEKLNRKKNDNNKDNKVQKISFTGIKSLFGNRKKLQSKEMFFIFSLSHPLLEKPWWHI